jgi:hypothetical protein
MLSGVLVVGKNAESRVVEQSKLSRERHENTIALPLANGGREFGRQSGWKQKADVLLVEVLKWYHDERPEALNEMETQLLVRRARLAFISSFIIHLSTLQYVGGGWPHRLVRPCSHSTSGLAE